LARNVTYAALAKVVYKLMGMATYFFTKYAVTRIAMLGAEWAKIAAKRAVHCFDGCLKTDSICIFCKTKTARWAFDRSHQAGFYQPLHHLGQVVAACADSLGQLFGLNQAIR